MMLYSLYSSEGTSIIPMPFLSMIMAVSTHQLPIYVHVYTTALYNGYYGKWYYFDGYTKTLLHIVYIAAA